MVDDHLGRIQRVDVVSVTSHGDNGVTDGGQVDHAGDTGEVLHDHAGRGELDLDAGFRRGIPVGDGLDVLSGDVGAVFVAQEVLAENLQ